MAWHVLHGLLESARVHSTFPGKLWIATMFIFRIVVVARIGEAVYGDEQELFFCNTHTPGCHQVCFNRFSPISQLRYWSLMTLTVSVPTIIFFVYSTHLIHHARLKFPNDDEEMVASPMKRARMIQSQRSDPPPLYEMATISNGKNGTMKARQIQRTKGNAYESGESKVFLSNTSEARRSYPIYGPDGRRVEFMKKPGPRADQYRLKLLDHPEFIRAYWWHVVFRTIFEILAILGQYYLYGWRVNELYRCAADPCPEVVQCWVSRPQEKSYLLWLMYGLGFTACLFSLAEFITLGRRNKFACQCGSGETYEERRQRRARLETVWGEDKKPPGNHSRRLADTVSLTDGSSVTTVESV